jgi:predicted Rossmann-fold nucleotide-binding protein
MEGASRGAVEAGGRAVGVTCAIFSGREPNRFLTSRREMPDLLARTGELIDAACGYIVLHGKSGTLAELTLVWALHRAGSLGPRPVVLLGDAWRPFLHHLVKGGMIEDDQLSITHVADGPEDAVDTLDRILVAEGARGE